MRGRDDRPSIDGFFEGRAFAVDSNGVADGRPCDWPTDLFVAFVKEARRCEAFYWLRWMLRWALQDMPLAITAGGGR